MACLQVSKWSHLLHICQLINSIISFLTIIRLFIIICRQCLNGTYSKKQLCDDLFMSKGLETIQSTFHQRPKLDFHSESVRRFGSGKFNLGDRSAMERGKGMNQWPNPWRRFRLIFRTGWYTYFTPPLHQVHHLFFWGLSNN